MADRMDHREGRGSDDAHDAARGRPEGTAARGVIETSEEGARAELRAGGRPVLVDFHATWCGPCRWLEPVLETLSGEFGEGVTFLKVDVDRAPALTAENRIASVPTVVLFRGGEEVGRSLGLEPERLRAMLEEVLRAEDGPGDSMGQGPSAEED